MILPVSPADREGTLHGMLADEPVPALLPVGDGVGHDAVVAILSDVEQEEELVVRALSEEGGVVEAIAWLLDRSWRIIGGAGVDEKKGMQDEGPSWHSIK